MEEKSELPLGEETLPPGDEEETVTQEITNLFNQGWSADEIIKKGGFARTTVNKIGKTLGFPGREKKEIHKLPEKLTGKEIIPPEAALEHIRLQDGDYKVGFQDGMSVLIMAARYNQLLGASQAEVLKGQLAIFKMAQEGSDKKMEQLASIVAGASEENKREILSVIQAQGQAGRMAASSNPMQVMLSETLAQTFQPMLADALGRVMTGLGGLGQPPPQKQPGIPPQGQPPQQEFKGMVEHHKIEELKQD